MAIRIRWKDFELPSRFIVDEKSASKTFGKFIVEPFEQGFGVTIGNGLRRILYSSIEGFAVASARIREVYKHDDKEKTVPVPHEFTPIPGVYEDTINIILNLKMLAVRFTDEERVKTLRLVAKEQGPVTAKMFESAMNVEILNPNQHLFTITQNIQGRKAVELEVEVRKGRRYLPSEEIAREITERGEIGVIPVDANFSPVKRVKYSVEQTRVGQKTNYDRLIIEIETNGALTPIEALIESAKIFKQHLYPIIQYAEPTRRIFFESKPVVETEKKSVKLQEVQLRNKLSTSLEDMGFSKKLLEALKNAGLQTVGDLVTKTEEEIGAIEGVNADAVSTIKETITKEGLTLGLEAGSAANK